MSYPLLEKAPKDHFSEEFIDFLRDNNEVIDESECWIMIANCKYDTPEKRHYTCFPKVNSCRFYEGILPMRLFEKHCMGWEILVKREEERTVKLWHCHFIQ